MTQQSAPQPFLKGHPFTWLAYAQLLRLPNVFTAMADICLAALATAALPDNALPFLLILLASSCLYLGGMVWNDVFDLEEDKRDRSFRPLPSGRVPMKNAIGLGVVLLSIGVALAGLAGQRAAGFDPRPLIVAGLLASNILFYDGMLKHTILGLVGMGGCRFLNVLLGLSICPLSFNVGSFLLALVVGVYIAGVTWFARTEVKVSNRPALLGAVSVMAVAVFLALALPESWPTGKESLSRGYGLILFPFLLVAFSCYVGLALHRAIRQPSPANVQIAVKRSVLGLVLFDAILAGALAGLLGLGIALLLLPAAWLGRRVYST